MSDHADESKRRKGMPVWEGCFNYFPDALLAVAEHSRKGNDKHNPGEPLHWSKHKSNDHVNCVGRHLLDLGPDWDAVDPEFGSLHAVALAWRALATAQIVIEAQRAGMKPRAYLQHLKEMADKQPGDAAVVETGVWVKHDGGYNPAPGQRVKVRLRDGTQSDSWTSSGAWTWHHSGQRLPFEIVAFKVRRG